MAKRTIAAFALIAALAACNTPASSPGGTARPGGASPDSSTPASASPSRSIEPSASPVGPGAEGSPSPSPSST